MSNPILGQELVFGVKPTVAKPVDAWSGPFTGNNVSEALAKALTSETVSIGGVNYPLGLGGAAAAIRFPSMQVRLLVNDGSGNYVVPHIYWFSGGTADENLIPFLAEGLGSQGFQGFQGPAGSGEGSGSQGFQGFQGNIGITGTQGFQGFQGFQGSQGFQGFQGNIGITGVQGFQGFQGSQGFQGFQGNIGITGVQGFQGFQGSQGFQGFQGNIGITGTQGFQGFQGNIGITGPTGVSVWPSIWITDDSGTIPVSSFQDTIIFFEGIDTVKLGATSSYDPEVGITYPIIQISNKNYYYGLTAPEDSDGITLGTKWFNTTVGAEFTYIIEDDNTTQWVMTNVFSATGPQGPAGSGSGEGSGAQGFQGFQGNIGITGTQGFQGFQGGQGFQGFQGNIGTIGILSDGTNSVDGGQQLAILGGTGISTTVDLISSVPTFTVGEIGWQRGGETFPQTIGGIAVGTSFGQGTSLNTILEALLFPYQPVSFGSFSIGINGSPFEVGQTAGNTTVNSTWTPLGPTSNWIANSIVISANQNVGTLVSGLNYNSSPYSITHGSYKLDSEGTLTFTITGQQEQGSNASRSTSLNWRYRYFYGKTGANYDGANLLNQGFNNTLTRTSPIDWTMNFPAGSDQAVYVTFPSSEYTTGNIRFRDTSTGFLFPFKEKTTFTHTNIHGLNISYDLYESSNEISAALSLKVEAVN